MDLEVWFDRKLKVWCLREKGYEEYEPLPDILTQNASQDRVIDLIRETFVIDNDDKFIFL